MTTSSSQASIVGIHGIANQYEGSNKLLPLWKAGIADSILAAEKAPFEFTVTVAFYGRIFRSPGTMAGGLPPIDVSAVATEWEFDFLDQLYLSAARVDELVPRPDEKTMAIRTPQLAQTVLRRVARSRFFNALGGERAALWLVEQAHCYLYDQGVRERIQNTVVDAINTTQPQLLIGHSLGSVVAYDLLCQYPNWNVDTLVTLGSPLGLPAFLNSHTRVSSRDKGPWPGVRRWVNVADDGDPVALIKELKPLFEASPTGQHVEDRKVSNGWRSHDVHRYLNTRQVGEAVVDAFRH